MRCRVCSNPSLIPCVSLGHQYLSAVFPSDLTYRNSVPQLPLDLVLCEPKSDGSSCGLLQLAHRLNLSTMYDAYPYTSSTNSSMGSILKDVADSGRALFRLQPNDVIVDVGCNDGTLLSFFDDTGCTLIGIDPAKNIRPVSTSRYTHVTDFFSAATLASVTRTRARLVFSVAMFYHLADPIGFAREVAACLEDDGVWIIQMAYLPAMLTGNMYDNIVHEHVGYYAVHQIRWIMEKAGLAIFDVSQNDVYGGSFRVFVKKKECDAYVETSRYHRMLKEEIEAGIFEVSRYREFMRRIEKTRTDLRGLCRQLQAQRKKVWVYGASTKGNTILQYCGVGKNEIVAAADANPFKLGKYVVGADIPIKDEASMRAASPDYLLALPYSFVETFMKREAGLVERGTKFIIPLPEVRIAP